MVSNGATEAKSVSDMAHYTLTLIRETGKILSDAQVEALKKHCGEDPKAAAALFKSLQEEKTTEKEGDSTENSSIVDLALSSEPIAYRDEFWDKDLRTWQLKRQNETSSPTNSLAGSVLVVRQRFTEKMTPCQTVVEIQGAKLMNIMRNIYQDAEGVNLSGETITIAPDYFFWARHRLEEAKQYIESKQDADTQFQIGIALRFIKEYWPKNNADQMLSEGVISFNYLWALYPPNCLIVGRHVLDEVRVFKVKHHFMFKDQQGVTMRRLVCSYNEYNGTKIGTAEHSFNVKEFPGSMPIVDLLCVPLHLHPNQEQIWASVLKRTNRQFTFFKYPFIVQEQTGLGLVQFRDMREEWVTPQKFKFHGRVMIDPARMTKNEPDMLIPTLSTIRKSSNKQTSRTTPDGRLLTIADIMKEPSNTSKSEDKEAGGKVETFTSATDINRHGETGTIDDPWEFFFSSDSNPTENNKPYVPDPSELSEDQLLLFSGLLHGYSLADDRWGAFSVANVRDVTWNHGAFKSLVMEPQLKDLMCRLIKSQHEGADGMDDFVRGKGKGLVGLLYGKPGLGKTLTAEAIAETAETPLFIISSGTLGHTAEKISKTLSAMLDLAAHWRAVLLLDEADVFLNVREDHDLERNAIVSIFLRELEYYQGILIMTTNRAESIDPAFQSRIHFSYQYPDLNHDARRRIWQNFVDKTAGQEGQRLEVKINKVDVDDLAKLDYNGRQIKNIYSIAVKLAVASSKALTKEDVLLAVSTLRNFLPSKGV